MAKKGGLGKGVDALFLDNAVEENAVRLSIDEIEPNRDQPRKNFDETALAELADSIREHGVLQPLLVRPMADGSYRLIAGERRYRAARMAGLRDVPVTIREMTDEEESIFALIENLQREDLNAIEEAEGLKRLIDTFGLTQEQAAARVGKSRTAVTNSLRLLNLPPEIAELVRDGKISMGHARALLTVSDPQELSRIAGLVVQNGISVRETERLAKRAGREKKAPEKHQKKRDSFYDEVELALRETLGRNVKVYVGKGGRGTLEIEFFGTEDLKKLAADFDEDRKIFSEEKDMLDMKFVRENPEIVKENIRKKFQDEKLPLVDEVIEYDRQFRDCKTRADSLRADRNRISKEIGGLMAKGMREEAEQTKQKVAEIAKELAELEEKETVLQEEVHKRMMVIPNIIADTVPIGKDDSENVELERFGEPVVPDFEIPYHVDIMETFSGIDLDSARKTSGNGFYYLRGDIARLHSAILSYARDFMIDRGFTYYVPPFMIRGAVVNGVMSFSEMENMMYKIEGEDLYLIGTSEHSMIGKFIDTILPESDLPQTLTSYSPCFRKEVGAHGIEERGVYRIHQFEKQEMVVVCKPEESDKWYDVLWNNTVDFFRSLDIPVRTLECCSGDLADLKVKSLDVEAWSPRQQKYFEVGSCSNLGDAQARRLGIRVKGENGNYYAHTLNNTVVAPPRMLIAFLENNLCADGTVKIPEPLRMYMGGKDKLVPNAK